MIPRYLIKRYDSLIAPAPGWTWAVEDTRSRQDGNNLVIAWCTRPKRAQEIALALNKAADLSEVLNVQP